jgi:hypothetical protein
MDEKERATTKKATRPYPQLSQQTPLFHARKVIPETRV